MAAAAVVGCSSNDNGGNGDSGTPVSSTFLLHYHRALSDYTGWNMAPSAGANESSASASSTDGFGAVYQVTVKSGATQLVFTLVNGAGSDPAGAITIDVSGSVREAWVFSGSSNAITHKPVAIPGANQVAVYYVRPDSNYTGWGLHTWGDVAQETAWGTPLQPTGIDPDLGEAFLVNTKPNAQRVNIIVHMGDTKDPGPDMGWDLSTLGNIVFVTSGSANVTATPKKAGEISITGAAAQLVEPLLVAWDVTDAAATSFELQYSATASIVASGTSVTGGQTIALTPSATGLPPAVLAKAPYLNTAGTPWRAFTIAAGDASKVQDALKGQVVAVARKADGSVLAGDAGADRLGHRRAVRLHRPARRRVRCAEHAHRPALGSHRAGGEAPRRRREQGRDRRGGHDRGTDGVWSATGAATPGTGSTTGSRSRCSTRRPGTSRPPPSPIRTR